MNIVNQAGKLLVPDQPKIVYLEGDGIGAEITPVALAVLDAAVQRAYGSQRAIRWQEASAGAQALKQYGKALPAETLAAIDTALVALKGPLTTAVGQGERSLNVSLRQQLDLYLCLRPVRYYQGVPSPVKRPQDVDMVVFRENTEDIYAGIEWEVDTPEVKRVLTFLQEEMQVTTIRFPASSAVGVKVMSREGSERLIRAAINWALAEKRSSVTLVHKGNIMKYTEGGFRRWGYELVQREFGAQKVSDGTYVIARAGIEPLVIKDCICDAFLQNIITRPLEYDVIATSNLNGDYVSDALAAQVGGIGIAPGANINLETGRAIFEATHGTAPDIAGKNLANPLSLILSGEMLLRYLGWHEAAEYVNRAVEGALANGYVTSDFHRLIQDGGQSSTLLGTKEFGRHLIDSM